MTQPTDADTPVTDPEVVAPQAAPAAPGSTVLLLGAGELSRELALAFQRLGAVVVAVDRYADAPAHGVADRSAVVRLTDTEAVTALIEREKPRYVVAQSGAIAADALIAVAERGGVDVFPTPRSTRLGQDREGLRRLASDELGLPTAPFWFAGSAEELGAVSQHAGFPLVVKPISGAPGEGQSVLLRAEDVEPAWQRAIAAGRITHSRVMAETVVEVDYEVTLLTVRSTGVTGPTLAFCEPIGHRPGDGDTLESWQPQQMTPAALDAAKSIAARIVNSLGGRGVFAVELLVRGDEVYFSDVRARPQDTGLVTLRSQRLSQFELHARAILGLAVDTIMISPGAAEVRYAGTETSVAEPSGDDISTVVAEALATQESDVWLFGRADETEGRRRLGVALATAPDVIIARDRARRVGAALCRLW
ncbi:phosphoribosylglycinamide formyltransferase 2 [Mycolicibacterium doricum]|uniref:Phosphoribosylglycinamide formyltransferase n=1 Tax=Mycolicibacterium doricum TaxID=126673 RepID=A0A1X1TEL6_9MYCO|nr:formate-dependent phosphoribosylglycinamide formyltransferase [Mycolicibacterium doricum]MCV7267816.1 formate-dependent phosphoribosylglycinamide formyltransferase [Mycolicibacterium doricum]ORV42995.1 phosphoribosylglycinamide formyltransferase [Mycolicibacterium doricum]BBZ06057.1 phosphoribosylglycinamide formyltransferase 2 [Mycolicibacterium doricum]